MSIKDFLKQVKSQKANRQFQFHSSLFIYAFSVATIYSVFYFIVKINTLGCWTAASAVLFVCGYILTSYGHFKTSIVLGSISLISMSFMGDFTFGWTYGTHFFLVCLIPLILASEAMTKGIKLTLCSFCVTIFFAMLQFITHHDIPDHIYLPVRSLIGDLNLFVSFGVLGFTMIRYSAAVTRNESELEHMNSKMTRIANTDQLTGIPNRRYIYHMIEFEIDGYELSPEPFVIAMVDIDDFKKINDAYGHLIGDIVLIEVVNQIRMKLRNDDIIGRWGGEEFLILLPQSNIENGLQVFERVRKSLAEKRIDCGEFQIQVTITIGIAQYQFGSTSDELVRRADECLYFGKQNGKNCVSSKSSIE